MSPETDPPLRRPSDLLREAGRTDRRPPGDTAPLTWPVGFVDGPEDRAAMATLAGLPSMTAGRLLGLSVEFPSAAACLAAIRDGRGGTDADRGVAVTSDPAERLAAVEDCGAQLVAVGDPAYPDALLGLFDPPAALLVRGVEGLEAAARGRSVAIVGARNCSSYGAEIAHALAFAVAGAGLCVVSGAARGIDAAAHLGVLEGGGATVAVLGCGIDRAYPPGNRKLLARIAAQGAVPEPFRFPARNRLIAALAEAIVVVEGTRGSGSMITAEHAIDLGRHVLAVPGPVTSELSQAPLALLRDGAGLLRGPEDLLDELGLVRADADGSEAPGASPLGGPPGPVGGRAASPDELAVLRALVGPQPADAVAASTGLPLPRALSVLMALEVRGAVRTVGGRFERTLRSRG